jgi:hypothetical protein
MWLRMTKCKRDSTIHLTSFGLLGQWALQQIQKRITKLLMVVSPHNSRVFFLKDAVKVRTFPQEIRIQSICIQQEDSFDILSVRKMSPFRRVFSWYQARNHEVAHFFQGEWPACLLNTNARKLLPLLTDYVNADLHYTAHSTKRSPTFEFVVLSVAEDNWLTSVFSFFAVPLGGLRSTSL